MWKLIVSFSVLEIVGLLAFIVISAYSEAVLFRFLPLLAAFGAICFISFSVAWRLSIKQIVYLSFWASVLSILMSQIVGFTIYSGLVKDIELLSIENAIRIGLMVFIGMIGHLLILTVAHHLGRRSN